jgi:hypothetical protein
VTQLNFNVALQGIMILKWGDSRTEKKAISGNLIKVIQDVSRARSLYLDLLKQATEEIMLMIPTSKGLDRLNNMGGVQILKDKSTNSSVKVRILTPLRGTHPIGESELTRDCKYWQEAQFPDQID